jgi:Na+-transporting NADH:ubiquinone oxidoreductase subunit C
MIASVAVDADLNRIRGVAFYEHGETPGLGGEVENSHWQRLWQGKRIYADSGEVGIRVVKGKAAEDGAQAAYEIDGLSGASLTTQGVDRLLHFWFGDDGFKPFFKQLRQEDTSNG